MVYTLHNIRMCYKMAQTHLQTHYKGSIQHQNGLHCNCPSHQPGFEVGDSTLVMAPQLTNRFPKNLDDDAFALGGHRVTLKCRIGISPSFYVILGSCCPCDGTIMGLCGLEQAPRPHTTFPPGPGLTDGGQCEGRPLVTDAQSHSLQLQLSDGRKQLMSLLV